MKEILPVPHRYFSFYRLRDYDRATSSPFLFTSEEVGRKKPDKLIYDVALRKMNGDPEKSVMIGNKFREDALGAVNAGMSAILVNSNVTEGDRKFIKKEQLDITIIEEIADVKTIL